MFPLQFSETVFIYWQCSHLPKNVVLGQLKPCGCSGQTWQIALAGKKMTAGFVNTERSLKQIFKAVSTLCFQDTCHESEGKSKILEVSQGGKRPPFLHSSPACAQAQHFSSHLSTTSRTCHLPDSSFIIKSIDPQLSLSFAICVLIKCHRKN